MILAISTVALTGPPAPVIGVIIAGQLIGEISVWEVSIDANVYLTSPDRRHQRHPPVTLRSRIRSLANRREKKLLATALQDADPSHLATVSDGDS